MSTPTDAHHHRPFAAVLFDMDGTLVDTEPLWHLAEVDTMRALGADWSLVDQAHALGGPMGRVAEYMADKVADTGQPRPEPTWLLAQLLDAFERHLDSAPVRVHAGAQVLIQEVIAAAVPLALVSNSPRRMIDKVLRANPDFQFGVTIAGDEVANGKPDPEPYLEAAARLEVRIADCLVVEDSPTGVAAARESGAWIVAVQHIGRLDPGPRGIVVDRLDGLTLAELARRVGRT